MKVAFVGAEEFEIRSLVERGFAARAGGPGFAAARRTAEALIRESEPDALASVGICGALDSSLAIGDIVVDEAAQSPYCDRPHRRGAIISVDRVIGTAREKRQLAWQGVAVEMEARAVAELARERGLKFFCIKAVSDTSSEDMPLDFNRYRASDGRFRKGRIALAALLRPFTVLAPLMRLNRQSQFAARRLGEFLADCRFE